MKRPNGFDARQAPAESLLNRRRTLGRGQEPDRRGGGRTAEDEPREAAPTSMDADTAPVDIVTDAGTGASGGASTGGMVSTLVAPPRTESAGSGPSVADDGSGSAGRDGRPPRLGLRQARRARKRHERGEIKRFTREARRRRRAWLIGAGSVAGVIVLIVAIALSPLMALRTITVEGASRVSAQELTRSLSSQLGTPLALIDYGAVRRAIDDYPLIRSYSTEARPPGTLVVRILERAPIGVLTAGTGFDLVDQAGVVISHTDDRPGGYPLIAVTGAPGSAEAKRSFAASAAVLAALPAGVLPQATDVTASSADDVTITLNGGVKVLWGDPERSDLKAADLAALLKSAPGASLYDVSSPTSPVTR